MPDSNLKNFMDYKGAHQGVRRLGTIIKKLIYAIRNMMFLHIPICQSLV